MKKLFIAFMLFCMAFTQMNSVQDMKNAHESVLDAGIGYARIDGQDYMMFNITPDLSFGKFGAGLNLELMFGGEDGFKFRKDAYEGGAGWLRAIRYLRWGQKGDEVFARVGTIDNGTLGNGFLMFHYTNEADYDNRKIGAILDLDFENYGFESIYSNFGRPEIFGARGYYRPLVQMDIPVISTLEAGLSYVADGYANPNGYLSYDGTTAHDDFESLSTFGFDIGMYLLKNKTFTWKTYFDYGKITDFGSGTAIGTSMNFGALGAVNVYAKYERRSLGENFVASIFNPFYELNKSSFVGLDNSNHKYSTLYQILHSAEEVSGNFFEVGASLLNTFHFIGNWQKLDEPDHHGHDHDHEGENKNGAFYGELLIDADLPFEISGRYVKTGIESISDLPGLNTNSLAELEIGYQLNTYLFLTTTYRFNWVEVEDENTGDVSFKEQKRVIPKLSFRYTF